MPPLIEYKFESTSDLVKITIKAYSFEGAYLKLIEICKNPADFKFIE